MLSVGPLSSLTISAPGSLASDRLPRWPRFLACKVRVTLEVFRGQGTQEKPADGNTSALQASPARTG